MLNDTQRARDALQAIPPDLPRDDWVRAGMAAHAAGLDFDSFDQWSAGADCYNAASARDTWRSFKHGKGLGAGTLFHMAMEYGWRDGHPQQRPMQAPRPARCCKPVQRVAVEMPHQHETLSPQGCALWRASQPIEPGTPAAHYLSMRRCVLPPVSGHLRWLPAHRHLTGYVGPCLVALLTDATTCTPRSLHFTWFAGGRKADVTPPRLLFKGHRKAGTVIRLWPDEYVTHGLGIAEGIETALSLAHGYAPVWSAIDAGNLAALPVLAGVEVLVIAQDRDPAGEKAAPECAKRWAAAGREVLVTHQEVNDLNDLVQGLEVEDGANIVRHRLAGICRAWGIDPRSLADRLHIVDGTENPELFAADARSGGNVTAAYLELSRLVENTRAGLVVVDNASDSFGGDEINRRQVRGFMRALVQVARLTDCAVCLLAHVDKGTSRNKKAEGGEGYSGSTAWHNSARSRLFMTRDESGLLTLEHQKSNLGRRREPIALEWPEHGLPTLINDAPSFDGLNAQAQGRADDEKAAALLALIAEFEGRGQYASPAVTSRNHPYALLKSEPAFQRLKLRQDDVKRIVNQCQRAGWIESLEYRTPDRKPHQRWTVTASGRAFAGLPAPTAPTTEDGAKVNMAQGGAPTAPTCVGGVGGERAHEDGANMAEACHGC